MLRLQLTVYTLFLFLLLLSLAPSLFWTQVVHTLLYYLQLDFAQFTLTFYRHMMNENLSYGIKKKKMHWMICALMKNVARKMWAIHCSYSLELQNIICFVGRDKCYDTIHEQKNNNSNKMKFKKKIIWKQSTLHSPLFW